MKPKILLVDDERNIIFSYSRGLRKDWDLTTAMSGEEGLKAIEDHGPFSVIVSDFNMPRMDGITFLVKSMDKNPEGIRMMLTGEGDFHIATKAVNEGNIFRFITKPCPLEQLEKALRDGYKQYKLTQLEKESRKKELIIAGEIQNTLLLGKVPENLNHLEIAAYTIPSAEIDGDFIDFFGFSEEKFDLVIGDVMGKGLHAAMVGAGAKSELLRVLWQLSNSKPTDKLEPSEIMESFRSSMNPGLEQINKFITMIYARFEANEKVMTFVDAGHTPILWYSKSNDRWSELKGMNYPIGIPPKRECIQTTVSFGSGDIFLFYSDGILEGKNSENIAFGETSLMGFLKNSHEKSAKLLLDELIEEYKNFVQTDQYFDDFTIVAVKII